MAVYNYGPAEVLTPDEQLDRAVTSALEKMKNEPNPIEAASNLLIRWYESDSAFRPVLERVVTDYLTALVHERAAVEAEHQAEQEAARAQEAGRREQQRAEISTIPNSQE
jgi:hypothetical protein